MKQYVNKRAKHCIDCNEKRKAAVESHLEVFCFLGGEVGAVDLERLGALRRPLRFDPDLAMPGGRGGSWPSTKRMMSHVTVPSSVVGKVPSSAAAPNGQPINFPAFLPEVTLRRKWECPVELCLA